MKVERAPTTRPSSSHRPWDKVDVLGRIFLDLITTIVIMITRYLTGINETAEDMSLQRKPGCPKLEVDSL